MVVNDVLALKESNVAFSMPGALLPSSLITMGFHKQDITIKYEE